MKNYLVATSGAQGSKMSIFAHSQQNRLTHSGLMTYRFPAAPTWVAGCRNPELIKATPDALSVFFYVAVSEPHSTADGRIVSMVALVGQLSGWPVSLIPGIPTPISVTTHQECRNSGGDSLTVIKEISAMLTTPAQSHPQKTYVFAAIRRSDAGIHPITLRVTASDERTARRQYARHFLLVLMARICLEAHS